MEWDTVSYRRTSIQRCCYLDHILHESCPQNINQYVQSNGSTGIVLAMTVFFLMVCCLLLVTVTAFVRVTVRLCAFIKPSNFRCVKLTITGKAVKVSLSEKQTKSEAK